MKQLVIKALLVKALPQALAGQDPSLESMLVATIQRQHIQGLKEVQERVRECHQRAHRLACSLQDDDEGPGLQHRGPERLVR